jgi:hypothetical protein
MNRLKTIWEKFKDSNIGGVFLSGELWLAFVLILLGLIAVHTAALTFHEWIKTAEIHAKDAWIFAISSLFFLLVSFGVFYLQHKHQYYKVRAHLHSSKTPKKVLTFFVSSNGEKLVSSNGKLSLSPPSNKTDLRAVDLACATPDDLLNDAKKVKATFGERHYWNWEMILRGIYEHRKKVERIYLIGSDESTKQLRDCRDLLKRYFDGHREVEIILYPDQCGVCEHVVLNIEPIQCQHLNNRSISCPHGCDFEKFEPIGKILDEIVDQEVNKKKTDRHDICIDVTGGKKIASSAGTAFTYNSALSFQYVSTTWDPSNPEKACEPYVYDVEFSPEPPENVG